MIKQVFITLVLAGSFQAAAAQTVTTRDISAELQSDLQANVPTVIYFDFNKSNLTDESKSVLDQQAVWLMSNIQAKVNLAGHTDAVGSNTYNDNLAMERARTAEQYLLSSGVSPEQMQSVIGRGENDLVVVTEKKERLNRRVTTSVTGLAQYAQAAPPPPPPPAPVTVAERVYATSAPLNCAYGYKSELIQMTDIPALRTELESRLDRAAGIYMSAEAQNSESAKYSHAAYTKAQCGIAIGFTKSERLDERSVSNCECGSNTL